VSGLVTCSGVELQIKHARELHKNHHEVLPKDTTDRELLKKAGRYQALYVCTVMLRLTVAACCRRCAVLLRLACLTMLKGTMCSVGAAAPPCTLCHAYTDLPTSDRCMNIVMTLDQHALIR